MGLFAGGFESGLGGLCGGFGCSDRFLGTVEGDPGEVAGLLGTACRLLGGAHCPDALVAGGGEGGRAVGEVGGLGVGRDPGDTGGAGVVGEGGGVAGDRGVEFGCELSGAFRFRAGAAGGGRTAFAFDARLPGGLLAGAHQTFQVGQLLDGLVGGGGAQLVQAGALGGERHVGTVGTRLSDGLLFAGRHQVRGGGAQRGGALGGLGAPGGEPVRGGAGVDPQIGGVAREEGAGGVVGGGQPLQGALHGLHVVEGTGGLGDQVVVERAQARGEGVGELGRVEVLRELRTAQREDQGEQLLVPLSAEAEQALVDGDAIVGRGGDQLASELGGELLLRHRPVVVRQEGEVLTDAAFGDEVPTSRLCRGASGRAARCHR